MALVTVSWLLDTLLFFTTLIYLLYLYLTSTASYFKSRGIPYIRSSSLLFQLEPLKNSAMDLAQILYNSFPGERFIGYFQIRVPTLVIKDVDLVQRVTVKDFGYFYDRGFPSLEADVLAKNLFNLRGQTWRNFRIKLGPTFTSGKIKSMFSHFITFGDHLLKDIEENHISRETVDAKVVMTNFSTEVVASMFFGLDFGKGNPQTNEFIAKINNSLISGYRQIVTGMMFFFAPKVLNLFRASFFTAGSAEYVLNLTKATKEYRIKNNVKRNDHFQLLLMLQEAEEKGKEVTASANDYNEEDAIINQVEHMQQNSMNSGENKLLTDEGICAQMMGFLMGGTDSVSWTLSFALYHIAKDPGVQAKLTKEVDTILDKHGDWTYQAVKDMTYLDQVIQETLRFYPILPINFRKCTTPYHIPDSDVVLEKGLIVAIPVTGLHMDPKYYPNPKDFNPERFLDNNHKPSPTYMPFGNGPRICIGMRFAIIEMKVCLAKIMSQYSVAVNSKTQEPFTFDKASFTPKVVGGIWLDFKKRCQPT